MRTETIAKRVRGRVGESVVVNARGPLLFWEDHFPIPSFAFEPGTLAASVLREVAPPTAGAWSFHGRTEARNLRPSAESRRRCMTRHLQ